MGEDLEKLPLWKVLTTWIVRILVGSVFVFSGFTKSVDVWGTFYKIEDYLGVMGLDLWPNLISVGSFLLCMLEFVTGAFLLLGCFRKSIPVVMAVVMGFMLPFTLWIALFDPVKDCGCFGDAYIISNWNTFWKNVALTAGVVWLMIYNRRIHWIITPSLQWICFIATTIYIAAIALIGYYDQPLLDFRPFKTGTALVNEENGDAYEPQYVFVYEKDGVKKEFGQDDEMPDEADGWKFVDRKETRQAKIPENDNSSLFITDENNDEIDVTEAIPPYGAEFILFMPSLGDLPIASSYKINSLYSWAQEHDVAMVALTGGTKEEIVRWKDIAMAGYPVFRMDDTMIKMIVRGNPALVYLEDGRIQWKRSLQSIPIDDFMESGGKWNPAELSADSRGVLGNISYGYLSVLSVLAALSFIPSLGRCFHLGRKKTAEVRSDDKDRP